MFDFSNVCFNNTSDHMKIKIFSKIAFQLQEYSLCRFQKCFTSKINVKVIDDCLKFESHTYFVDVTTWAKNGACLANRSIVKTKTVICKCYLENVYPYFEQLAAIRVIMLSMYVSMQIWSFYFQSSLTLIYTKNQLSSKKNAWH